VAKIIHPGDAAPLLPTMSSSERESRKLLRCKEGSYWHISDLRGCPLLNAASGAEALSTVVIHAAGIYEYTA
jgi:hypothetical protein